MRTNHSVIACSASTKQTCHALEYEWYESEIRSIMGSAISAALESGILMHNCRICMGDADYFVFLCGL